MKKLFLPLLILPLISTAAHAVVIDLAPPGAREFVRDLAGLLSDDDKKQVKAIAEALLKDKATPIIVVTIDSMAQHGGRDLRIETFARLLFDQWEIGHAKVNDKEWNTGILFLVSVGDRKARIELGAGWKRDKDVVCQRIMDEIIIPRFKTGDYSGGIVAGVAALDRMVRENLTATSPLPATAPPGPDGRPRAAPSSSPWPTILLIGGGALVLGTLVSIARKGNGSWGWLMWSAIFGLIGVVLFNLLRPRHSSGSGFGGSGGGFSGGSFGGGFSGGGGASGSW